MRLVQGWMAMAAMAGALALAVGGAPLLLHAQETRKQGFYNVEELKRLLEVARESGFTEEELKEITIEDDGRVINVYAYLAEIERRKRLEAEKLRREQEKQYLTVQDLFDEMRKEEPEDLSRLRDQLQKAEQ